MSTACIVVLTFALGAGGVTASPPGGSATGTPASALRGTAEAGAVENISEDQASKRSESVNGVRQRVAILTTAQK
jgi:hypothetical protein